MLIADLALLRLNPPLPDSVYILLQGKGIDSIRTSRQDRQNHQASPFEGAHVLIRITVRLPYHPAGATLPKTPFIVDQRPEKTVFSRILSARGNFTL